jgi:hypothetical protein
MQNIAVEGIPVLMMNKTDNKYDLKRSDDKMRSTIRHSERYSDKCVKITGCTVSGLNNHILRNETYIIKTLKHKTPLKKK